MRFKVGDLVRVIQAADQSLWERMHVGQIGLIVETITYDKDYSRVRYKVLIEEHFAVFHPLDLEPLKNEDR
jgi:paraquat-inducible protein B